MKNKNAKKRKAAKARSLGAILWFTFAVFAFVLLVINMAVLNVIVGEHYRDQTVSGLKEAAGKAIAAINETQTTGPELETTLSELKTRYDVEIRILDPSTGYSVFPGRGNNAELVESLEKSFSENGKKDVVINGTVELGYASCVQVNGAEHYLYVSSSVSRLDTIAHELKWASFMTALLSVVLAFVASGFAAMLIAKPVSEVTELAKNLARGNYDLNFKRSYFCSEMTELSETLEYARSEISKADTMQKELIANVSHDFRTPLTMIKAYASMIKDISGEDKKKRDFHAQVIIDESDRLAMLVEDLLDLSKLRSGVGTQAPVVFNLSELVYSIVNRFSYLRETSAYLIETEIDDDLYTFAEKARIEQVVYNLIGNAVNYTGADKKVTVRLFSKDNVSRFEVTDTGKGIPAEEIETIWDRYYRARDTHKRPVKGTGLGLSIVKNILVHQNCPFGVLSEVGKGSTFWVEFAMPPEEGPAPDAK